MEYEIITIVSDNNRVNRKMFKYVCGGTLESYINNPSNNNKQIFLFFDTVHIFKSIRNNWLNQSDCYQSFIFPKFPLSDQSNSKNDPPLYSK